MSKLGAELLADKERRWTLVQDGQREKDQSDAAQFENMVSSGIAII
jgi:hypothetical protein